MKSILKIVPFCFVLFFGCNKEVENENISYELQEIINNGVTVDSVVLDYATIFTSNDFFSIIEPNAVDNFVSKNEALLYFKFISDSRDMLEEYFHEKYLEELKQGIIVERMLKYYDYLENISLEVKINDNDFQQVNVNSDVVKFIPTPEINSGDTFAKYEMTKEEFIDRNNRIFPDSFILCFNNKDLKLNTYVFKITFILNNKKEFILQTDKMEF
ncbi:hypothetical protein [Lutibacter citreus]|uniref:hypothetical protein n=1 Tax=Lutibacter citreus TaxID=2138210 RepID=UPI000DBE92EE|nr:hypothetical protein [Lutibacter citreus]